MKPDKDVDRKNRKHFQGKLLTAVYYDINIHGHSIL
jgi:hypothetical protein